MIYVLLPTTKERRPRLEKCISSLYTYAGMPFTLCVYENEPRGAVKAIHEMIENIDGIVWWIQDDVILTEPDTLKRLYERYNEHYGVICPDDGIQHGEIITLPFCQSDVIKYNLHKGYYHNYGDKEFTEIMRADNMYTYCPDIKVSHQHWTTGETMDETYRKSLLKDNEDKVLYERRKQKGFR